MQNRHTQGKSVGTDRKTRTEKRPEEGEERIWASVLSLLAEARNREIAKEGLGRKSEIWNKTALRTFGHLPQRRRKRRLLPLAAGIALMFAGLGTGYLLQHPADDRKSGKPDAASVEVRTPMGAVSDIRLPDGTRVTLNGGSRLTYPASFAQKVRRVSLDGEGYFEVMPDPSLPFLVKTTGMDVRVHGTRFTLKSYPGDPKVSVALAEGKIEAVIRHGSRRESIAMRPGRQVDFDRTTGTVSEFPADANEITAWIDGILYFRDVTLEEIARRLERKFGVEIRIDDERLRRKRYYGQFENQENLTQILAVLSYKNGWDSRLTGKTVTIYPTGTP